MTAKFENSDVARAGGIPGLVVVAPAFNHGEALRAVLVRLAEAPYPQIVVNDGSTDATAEILAEWIAGALPGSVREVVVHTNNRGKAAALRSGFARAADRGYTHALTIDTDGQHDVADVGGLVDAAVRAPKSLIIGARERDDVQPPLASRIGRAISNQLVWCESGVRIRDSQSGMRVYPLRVINELDGGASRYGFETQVISRAGWSGVPVVEVPIRSIYALPGGRTTHFRLVFDTLLAARMHAGLLARSLLFVPADRAARSDIGYGTGSIPGRLLRWLDPVRLIGMAKGEPKDRERLAASVGTGLVIATLPLYGVKTVLCMWLAGRYRLNPLAVIGVSSLSTPPLGVAFIATSIFAGHVLTHGSQPSSLISRVRASSYFELLGELTFEWVAGSLLVGAVLGFLGYVITRVILSRVPRTASARDDATPEVMLSAPVGAGGSKPVPAAVDRS